MRKPNRALTALITTLMAMMPISFAQSAMVTTPQALQAEQTQIDRAYLLSALKNKQLQQQLVHYGLDADLAAERIRHMSDVEIAMLNKKIDELPAGEGIVGTILIIFIVFVITDALGATDVFPFVRPIN